MKKNPIISALLLGHIALVGITSSQSVFAGGSHAHQPALTDEVEKGPNNGRMLRDGDLAIELAIFETGVPPEFRIYATNKETVISPSDIDINVKLTRLGDVVDDINFFRENDYLRGDMEIYEPHSFAVTLTATYQGKDYHWHYDNFEGRVTIADDLAKSMDIQTSIIGPKTLHQRHQAYGKLVLAPNAVRQISARFAGEVKKLHVTQGQWVSKGQKLLTVESNNNLSNYDIKAPMAGYISAQMTGVGEQTGDKPLLTITDTRQLIAEVAVYGEMKKIAFNAPVALTIGDTTINASFFDALPQLTDNQAKIYRAYVDNSDGKFSLGQFTKASISLGTFNAAMAVNKDALQAFRDFTVVYTKIGEQYEVRMLELGRESDGWVEILSGINPGDSYVSKNSYIIKADIEKSGASHDH
ncbi:MAG: efflux RND transporter periplasmic adaptor subunit [Psychrobium sp.]